MNRPIERRFAFVSGRWGERQVHYRAGGSGPLLLLLHQSPQSSRELVPLMEAWAQYFTVLAPDSPGYGLSDPLGVPRARLDDFAEATLEFVDAIGARRFGVYGFHTGGMIGLALADRYPGRVAAAASNGVLVPTPAELASMLEHYLPPFVPQWDGSHLAWLWGRNREQTMFFPWHERTQAARMDFPMAPPDRQQGGVLEFLRAADHYHVAYEAAFRFRADQVAARLKVPTVVTAARWDPLCPHLKRLPGPAAGVRIVESADPGEALRRCLEHLRQHAVEALSPVLPAGPARGRQYREIVQRPEGALLVQHAGAGTGRPVVLLHGAGASSGTLAPLTSALAQGRRIVALDLPGHGESESPASGSPVNLEACVAAVRAALASLRCGVVDLIGVETGGLVGLELLAREPGRVGHLLMLDAPALDDDERQAFREQGLPSLAADWHGGHLSRCWHMVRDSRLFFPWFRRDQAAIRWCEPDLDPRTLQLEVTAFLKAEGAWQSLLADALNYPLRDRLASAPGAVTLAAAKASPWHRSSAALAGAAGTAFMPLPDDPPGQGALMLQLLGAGTP